MSDAKAHLTLFTPSLHSSDGTRRTGQGVDMRDSSIPWLGQVPTDWTVDRLRWTIAGSQNGTWGDDPDGVNDIICVRVADFDRMALRATIDTPTLRAVGESERKGRVLQRGDLLLEKSGGGELQPVGAVVQYDHDTPAVCSNFVARVRIARGFDSRFLTYLHAHLYAGRINTRSIKQTTGIQNLDAMAYFDERAAWPPLPEQEAIAAWLDERTRRVDELVAAKRRLIDLLAEQRSALITHAVTKGLDASVPTKPSGVEWIGAVPRHWTVKRLRYLCLIQTGDKDTVDAIDDGEFPFFVRSQTVEHIDSFTFDCEAVLTAGDGVGVGKVFHHYVGKFDVHQRVYVMYRFKNILGRYLYYFLKEQFYKVALEGAAKSTVDSLRRPMFTGFPVSLPPLEEQRSIVAHLDAACAKLDDLTTAAEAAIARLTEYRQALISAAVTGKINICGAASIVQPEAASSCEPVIAGRINGEIGGTGRTANKHFQRSVLAAEIIARIGQDRTFGRVKLQKALILAEGHLQLAEIESQPMRAAAGPFDNAMMRSIQSQLQKSQWYEYRRDGDPLKFVPLAKAGGHKQYFERYWGAKEAAFAALMHLLAKLDTQRSEIVATLYSAWNDFLIDQKPVTDDALVAEVLTNWDPAKTAIPEDKWRKAIGWMRSKGLVPTGYGAHTKARVIEEAD